MKYYSVRTVVALLWLTSTSILMAAPPDLTAPGVIASINRTYTYNLGPTGLRGWIYVGGGERGEGTITVDSRQILVTVASAPANTVLAVDDVILGAIAASSGEVPLFTNDARKAFAVATGESEKTGAGTLRVKRWRAGATTDVNISMAVMGEYSSTTPYSCPKSSLILTNALNKFVGQLLADSNFLNKGQLFARSIHALALLGGVAPSHPDYAAVQSRLQTYARAIANTGPNAGSLRVWENAYSGLFLSEYFLATGDTNVLAGLGRYTVSLANSQSMYGTYGHDPALGRAGSSGRHNIGYGPVNQVGIVAGLAMVMGKKALEAGGQAIDPELTPAIQRSNAVLAWFANKGTIPYGEHDPVVDTHESNGKNASCAVLFGLQADRAEETEFFTRLSVSGFASREYGHTGQGFSYLWGALGANVGGPLATSEYLKNVRWHLDLTRRTDGSFTYDGQEASGPGVTADGTYLGTSSYNDLNATAIYILTFSLPLQRLYITGKNALPGNTLDSTKVAHAIAATTFKQNIASLSVAELITALSDFDPIVRHHAATELGKRSLNASELSTLRGMVTDSNVNARMGACQALGLRKDATALPLLVQRLDKTNESNSWVRSMAANAIRYYAPATASAHLETLLAAFVDNATETAVVDWDDPFQYSNGNLGFALFGDAVYGWMVNGGASLATYTINASTNMLYPALRTGFRQPESKARLGPAQFAFDRLSLPHVQALIPDVIELAKYECQVDRMWGSEVRAYGIRLMGKHKITEGVAVALSMLEVPAGFSWGAQNHINPALDVMDAYGDAARWTLPQLRTYRDTWNPADSSYPMQVYPNLLETINNIDNAITAPACNPGLAVAHSQVVSTTGTPVIIMLAGASPLGAVRFLNVITPAHGTLTGTAPKLTYTPASGYTGPDHFTFQVTDNLTTSETATVSIIVGTPGTGLKGEYYDNADFTNLKLTRTDAQINFDWGTGSPDASLGADTFSVRWSGLLLVPESGNYTFSSLSSEGMRLYVNGTLVIDNFVDQSTRWTDGATIYLIKGQMADMFIEYYENTGSAVAKLKWTGPSFAGLNGAIIPQSFLFDGSTISNRPAFAFSQNLSINQNTVLPITLQGSGGSLTYTVLTQPANGTLNGTAPDLTYTPNTSFTGTDSFTFLVNNGSTNSLPATITLGVQTGPLTHFTWATASAGNWSDAAKWTTGAPVAAGQPNYALNFNVAGTYTATHNLNTGFQLNQLNTAAAVTIDGTRSLSFVVNGSTQPTFNQNSGNLVTVVSPIQLAALTRFSGSGSGEVVLTKQITGSGGILKSSSGRLRIHGADTNNFSGGTTVNSGTLVLGANVAGVGSLNTINPLGTGPVTLNGATLELERVTASHPLTVNGGTLFSMNGWGATWSGPITLNQTLTTRCNWPLTLSGTVSGNAGIIKIGSSTLTLGVANSYTGTTEVLDGTLTCNNASALGKGPLAISLPAKVNLNFSGTCSIDSLTLNGTPMPAGTYGSTASAAANKNDTYFSGTGILNATNVFNNAPSANAQAVTTPVNTAKDITLSGSDPDGNPLTYTIVTQPANGTLTGTPPNVTLTPATDFAGIDSFTFKVNDGMADSAEAMVSVAVTSPNTPPVAPTGLSAVGVATNQINLAWTDTSTNETGFVIERSTTSGSGFAPIVVTAADATSYSDTGLAIGQTYYYRMYATNETDVSATTVEVSAATRKLQATVTLGNLTATYDGEANPVSVTTDPDGLACDVTYNGDAWAPTNAGSYAVVATINEPLYEGTTNGTQVVSKATPTVTAWPTAASITEGQAVAYATLSGGSATVAGNFAYDSPGFEPPPGIYGAPVTFAPSNTVNYESVTGTVNVTVTEAVPPVPSGLVAIPSVGAVELGWNASATATGYNVKRSTTPGSGYATLIHTSGTSYIDTGVSPGVVYYYVVSAVNAGGESANSSEASATLPFVLPFADDFESASAGPLDGQNGWEATDANVQTSVAIGTNAVSIDANTGFVRHAFSGNQTNVWTDMQIRPVFAEKSLVPSSTNWTTVVYFNTNGHPVVFDGTNRQELTDFTVTNGNWTRVTVKSDYAARTWDLYINGISAARDLGFYNTAVARYERLEVRGGSASDGAKLDDVSIGTISPFGTMWLLTVLSAHGSPVPAVGTTAYSSNDEVIAWMPKTSITNGLTNYVCTGWVGTGSAGSGSGTNTSFTITSGTTLTWQWQTNYWIELDGQGE